MEFLEPEKEILDEDINEFLKEDLALAEKPLSKVATLRVSQGQKDFFDYLHLSPLKVSRYICIHNINKNILLSRNEK